ncbi:ComF family protein [Helicobacter burdigaliensis]|uniref:ComF family protein n=1 Tax=Helicobacter burdigaliensis TaxID=2315334 RepID=UPI000EF74352|nr:phosphoribosyltransferase family protein [Helicobacter burdigaliensis]
MRCLICGKFSFGSVCKVCQDSISLNPRMRELESGFRVYSFYEYSSNSMLFLSKYQPIGSKIYKILSKKAIFYLRDNLEFSLECYGVGIDEDVKKGYAQNSIFLKELQRIGIKPLYNALEARNKVTYAGKDLKFRLKNPRNFKVNRSLKDKRVILVDDIITTGTTLKEAKVAVQNNGGEVICAFTLADAKE